MKAQVDTTQKGKKNRIKQSTKSKEKKNLMQIGPKATKWRPTINKKDLRQENSHLPQIG